MSREQRVSDKKTLINMRAKRGSATAALVAIIMLAALPGNTEAATPAGRGHPAGCSLGVLVPASRNAAAGPELLTATCAAGGHCCK